MTCYAVHICSFCGQTNWQVRFIINSPKASICNECVDECAKVVAANAPPPEPTNIPAEGEEG